MDSTENLEYIKPVDRIFNFAIDRDELDWKLFLHNLIQSEGLNPWDINLQVLTKKYLQAIKEIETIDFNVSGKFLTIAVFLLKTKVDNLIDIEIRGLDSAIEASQNIDSIEDFNDSLDDLENDFNQIEKKKKYQIKLRNPLARKRKVNIYDLIKTLEKTFAQSNKRKVNFFLKNSKVDYTGPEYEKKPKDLKIIIEELYALITNEFSNKTGSIYFHHILGDVNHKEGILDKFIPLLHLHNQNRIKISQEKHFGEIKIALFD